MIRYTDPMTDPTTTPVPSTLSTPGAKGQLDRVQRASRKLVFEHPHFFAALSRVQWKEDPKASTFNVSPKFEIRFNPEFSRSLTGPELIGVIAHECLHPVFDHFDRAKSIGLVSDAGHVADPQRWQTWGIACDMVINAALRESKITLPKCAVYPPTEYTGALRVEPIYQWLREKQQEKGEQSEGGEQGEGEEQSEPQVTAGCLPVPTPDKKKEQGKGQGQGEQSEGDGQAGQGQGDGSDPSDSQSGGMNVSPMSPEMKEIGEQIRSELLGKARGEGSSAMEALLERTPSRTDWRQILTGAVSQVARTTRRDWQTYSRRDRRSPIRGVQWPGWQGMEPRIALVIDCSSSMSRDWIKAIIGHAERLCSQYPGTRIYLVTHTDRVTFEGWLKPGGDTAKLFEATAHGGGTRVTPAYDAIRALNARFDFLVHFTDCEIEMPWPEPPARRCVIGAFGSGAVCPDVEIPAGARLLPCKED